MTNFVSIATVMRQVATDCEEDATALDRTPFNAKGIGSVLGEHLAMISTVAKGVAMIADELAPTLKPTYAALQREQTGDADAGDVDRYAEGYDKGVDDVWLAIVCSVCGVNHDQDESAACEGCEPITFQAWVDGVREERTA